MYIIIDRHAMYIDIKIILQAKKSVVFPKLETN